MKSRFPLAPALATASLFLAGVAHADPPPTTPTRLVEIDFRPTEHTQFAVWIERNDALIRTLALTRAVAYRGIGNRPGALQMNSGFRWPYGRREGALPVWAHRRAAAPGSSSFSRVIFQSRAEGDASGGTSSRDDYFCLSFNVDTTRQDALDAVSCASVFNSDKGRYLTLDDVAHGYAEPYETMPGSGEMRRMDTTSLYPPRRDIDDHAFVSTDSMDAPAFSSDARRVMPEIDAITTATPALGVSQTFMLDVPDDWPDGDYVAYIEVNTEGDQNSHWYSLTPRTPDGAWDSWAMGFGYAYRGQPSVVFRVAFRLGDPGTVAHGAADATGYGSFDGVGDDGGAIHPMDATISNDHRGSPGSGVDRLLAGPDGNRVTVRVMAPTVCETNTPPTAPTALSVSRYSNPKHTHEWASLHFLASGDDHGIVNYDVRVSTSEIVDEDTFLRALPANAASADNVAVQVPTDVPAGQPIDVDFGGLMPLTHYYVGVRASDACNTKSPVVVGEITTSEIHFTTVTPCFIATATYGTPLAGQIGVLRRFRDRHLMPNGPGRAVVAAYYEVGPWAASWVRESPMLRAATRDVLDVLVGLLQD